MTTAVLQCLVAVLKLCFGITALRVARLTGGEGTRSTAWLVVGIALALTGASSVLHSGWALWAVLAGPETAVYGEFLRWMPAANYSRHAVMLVLGGLLLAVPLLHRLPRRALARATGGLLLGSAVAGGWVGVLEGSFREAEHYVNTAALDSLEMVLLFGALLAALVLGTMDRVLWLALAVYATRQSLNVLSFSAIAWLQVPGLWSPSPRHIAWTGSFLWALLLGLALYRLALAGRGERTPALLEAPAGRAQSIPS